MHNTEQFNEACAAIVRLSRLIHAHGWVPATSGNFSLRLDAEHCAITASGIDKGQLLASDVLCIDLAGQALPGSHGKPSAETALHTQLYKHDAGIAAVLHTHDMNSVLAAKLLATAQDEQGLAYVVLEDLELLKAFAGVHSHAVQIRIPVFANTQDITALAARVERFMSVAEPFPAYLIKGHGLYTWGRSADEALRHLEALNQVLAYLLSVDRHSASGAMTV